MALTRRQLRALGLTEEQVDTIIEAHVQTVDALKQERDAARAETDQALTTVRDQEALTREVEQLRKAQADSAQVQADFDEYRRSVQQEKQNAQLSELVRTALIKAGANEKAVPLLAREIPLDTLHTSEDGTVDIDAALTPVRERYAEFFSMPQRTPAPTLTPPIAGSTALTREAIGGMSQEEINRNWQAVASALAE